MGSEIMRGNETIATRLAGLPTLPGVYIFRDANRRVIYVGKAIVLRNRVRSYFQDGANHTAKTERLVADIADLEWIVTASELEALILENELIKRYRPRYNIRLKDDKRYPYIKVTWQEDYPKIHVVRTMQRDGARYFGPFTSTRAVYQTLDVVRRIFPYCSCNRPLPGTPNDRPCFYYHIKRCPGPCIGAVTREEYREIIDRACMFLEGKQEEVVHRLHGEMQDAAEQLNFEYAAQLRDQIAAVTTIIERQRIVSSHLRDHDFVAFARDDSQACVQVFFIRGGKLIGREYFVLTGAGDEDETQVMTSFIKQFYDDAAYVPPEILVHTDLDDLPIIEQWLRQKRGNKVVVKVPRRGEKRALMRMALENAEETLTRLRAEWEADTSKHVEALSELQHALDLPEPPSRIECYDISNIQGTAATGSMVVFVQGAPSKQDYRHFRIKSVDGPNDFASMAEVLRRRFARARERADERSIDGKTNRWAIMPDLVIVDGGKGQLSAALEAMEAMGVGHIPVAALAKQNEELFVPGRSASILLPRDSQALYLVQRIRDEAHRFAITYHRKLREKRGTASLLDEIPGIGPKRRRALLQAFGSVDAIRQASVDDLVAIPGITRRLAEQVLENL
ncbi:MAG TPA: excinuclease ABC subunit UvrC [Chloroflexi bacterium]|nr:excinuclease ABC subunit UvrC [Chloroflexota bacterium]